MIDFNCHMLLASDFLHSALFKWIFIIAGALVVILVFIGLVRLSWRNSFFLKKDILDDKEKELYSILADCLGSEYAVIPQVDLSEAVGMKHSSEKHKINQVMDFVVFSRNFVPLTFIVMKGGNDKVKRKRKDDVQLEKICKKTGATSLEISTKKEFNVDRIKADLLLAVNSASREILENKHKHF